MRDVIVVSTIILSMIPIFIAMFLVVRAKRKYPESSSLRGIAYVFQYSKGYGPLFKPEKYYAFLREAGQHCGISGHRLEEFIADARKLDRQFHRLLLVHFILWAILWGYHEVF